MKKTKIIAAISALTIIFSAAPIQPFYDVISNCEVTANAVAEQFGDYMFDTETGTITKHVGTDEEITIPSEINGVTVTSIGDYAF